MKKNILVSIFTFFTFFLASAQMLSVDATEINLSGSSNDADIYDNTGMTNSTTETIDLRWVRTIVTMPDEWDNYFCTIPGNCGFPSTDSLSFELAPGEIGDFQIHFAPNNVEGSAEVRVDLINNIDNAILETIFITATADGTVSINELEAAKVKVFPNPAVDYFQIQNGGKVDQVLIFNILGKQVKFYEAGNNNYFVGDLAKGLYMVQMIDFESDSIKTLALRKTN